LAPFIDLFYSFRRPLLLPFATLSCTTPELSQVYRMYYTSFLEKVSLAPLAGLFYSFSRPLLPLLSCTTPNALANVNTSFLEKVSLASLVGLVCSFSRPLLPLQSILLSSAHHGPSASLSFCVFAVCVNVCVCVHARMSMGACVRGACVLARINGSICR
jgi:hypothetical protein